VQALGREIREEVLEVVFLVRVDAETNNSLTRLLVHVRRPHRVQLDGVLNGVHVDAAVISPRSEFPHTTTLTFTTHIVSAARRAAADPSGAVGGLSPTVRG
jgi:hypothetical protein